MKKGLFIIVMLCSAIAGRAQQVYDTFIVEGKKWNVNTGNGNPVYDRSGYYLLKGDTILSGHRCKKMFFFDSKINNSDEYCWGMYEEGQKVYAAKAGTDEFALFYDFGLQEGEWCNLCGKNALVVKVDTIESDNFSFRRMVICFIEKTDDDGYSNGGGRIDLSGIGCVNGHRYAIPMFGGSDVVKSIEIGDGLTVCIDPVEVTKGLDSILEKLTGYILGVFSVPAEEPQNGVERVMFDLHGRRLTSKPEKGVYIEGGRKRVAGK